MKTLIPLGLLLISSISYAGGKPIIIEEKKVFKRCTTEKENNTTFLLDVEGSHEKDVADVLEANVITSMKKCSKGLDSFFVTDYKFMGKTEKKEFRYEVTAQLYVCVPMKGK